MYAKGVRAIEGDVEWLSQWREDCLHPVHDNPHRHCSPSIHTRIEQFWRYRRSNTELPGILNGERMRLHTSSAVLFLSFGNFRILSSVYQISYGSHLLSPSILGLHLALSVQTKMNIPGQLYCKPDILYELWTSELLAQWISYTIVIPTEMYLQSRLESMLLGGARG